MIDPVVIQFVTGGLPEVDRAFATIEERIKRAESAGTRAATSGAEARVKGAQREVADRERAYLKLVRSVEQAEQQQTKAQEREQKQRERATQQAMRGYQREAQQSADREIREAQRATREVERLEQYKLRVRIRSSEMAGRAAVAEAERETAARQRMVHGAAGGIGRAVGGVMSYATGALAIGGGFLLADAAHKQMAAERQASQLVNAVTTGGKPPAGANVANILAQANLVSAETGMSKSDIIGGTLEYSRKARGGDFKGAMNNMGFFAKMANVTGADINEIAGAAGTLQSQNPSLKAPEMQQMLLDVYAQGKAGSMSMVDVAKQIGVLASTRSSYAGDAATNQRKLLALGQLAAPEGSVEEAGTFIKDLTSEAGTHRKGTRGVKGLEAMGVKYDKYGRMESPEQMISAVFKGTGGDITKIEQIFGKRGTALFRSLQPAFVEAGGGEKGLAAVQAKMASVTGATMTPAQLEAQHAQEMSTPAARLAQAFATLESSLGEKLEPALSKLADRAPEIAEKFGAIVEAAAGLAEWFLDNPLKGIGAIMGAAVLDEVGKAALPKLLEAALKTTAGQGLAIAAAAIAVEQVGEVIINQMAAADVKKQQADVASSNAAANAASNLLADERTGKVTPADIAEAQKQKEALEARLKEQQSGPGTGDNLMVAGVGAVLGPRAAHAIQDVGDKRRSDETKNTIAALALLNAALKKVAATANNVDLSRTTPITERPK